MSDQLLAEQLKEGDSEAFKELYHKHIQKLYAFVLRMAKSPQLAEDIVHDVFVKLWKNRQKIDPEQSFKAYLFTIARNHLLNFIKRRTHKREILEEMFEHASKQNHSTKEQVMYNESFHLFQEAIKALPPKRQKVFRLCHLDGFTYEETADRLDITSSTVNTHMVKARKFIREYITQSHSIPDANR